jgi:outer membrane protein TolC
MGRWLLPGIVAGTLTASAHAQVPAAAASETLTVDQAVALAIQANRSIRTSELDVHKADDAIASARTRRKPIFQVDLLEARLVSDLNIQFSAGSLGTFPSTGPIPSQDTTITSPAAWTTSTLIRVSQPLSQLHKIGLTIKQLELARGIAEERLRARRQAVAFDIRRLCYGLLQTEQGVTVRQQSLELHREILRLVGDHVREGTALSGDELEAKSMVAREENELLKLKNAALSLHEQLNAVMGRDLDTPFTLAPITESADSVEDVAALEVQALAQRPEIREAALSIQQAEYGVRLSKAERLPDVSATFGYLGLYNYNLLPSNITAAGVLFSWEPWDWGRRRSDLSSRQRTVEQASATARDAEALVRTEVRAAVRKLDEARTAINAAQLGYEAAQEKLRVTTESFKAQRALLRDVLQAQTVLAGASQQQSSALLALKTARAELDKALGNQ